RRVHRIGRARCGGHHPRLLLHHQHQARTDGRLLGGPPRPRPVPGPRGRGVVRRHAGDGPRPRGERGAGGAARLHPPGRHLRLPPLLRHRPHRTLRTLRRPPFGPHRPGPRRGAHPVHPGRDHHLQGVDPPLKAWSPVHKHGPRGRRAPREPARTALCGGCPPHPRRVASGPPHPRVFPHFWHLRTEFRITFGTRHGRTSTRYAASSD